ncbi:MAG: DUF58 domain-containing protein [Lentisphaeraceae bacterium]|nr:DUF58 domain-containing protein [Lentisphaeraceae bacterium]
MSESDLGKYLDPKVVSAVQRLDLQAKCIIEGFISGRHRSPFHGFSSQFSEHRKYNIGDPIKDIDWNVYAKTERHYIKKYEAETNLDCNICVDISSSMGYQHEDSEVSKLEYAIYLTAAISYMLTKQSDSVGLITFDQDLCHYIRPKSKKTHLTSIINTLAKVKTEKTSDFKAALPQTLKLLKHRGLVVIFSDFLGDTESALNAISMLRCRKNDVIVFQVMDRAEIDLPFSYMANFVDTENNEIQIKAKAESIRKAYQEEIQTFIKHIENECTKIGVTHVLLNTSDSFDKALEQFILKRSRCF